MSNTSATDLNSPLQIGDLQSRNRVFLAPMSGVSDLPFRDLAWKYGAGLVVSEMVASQAVMEGEPEMQLKLERGISSTHIVQLAGREPEWMARAAKLATDCGADGIDINMGCPAKRVTTGYSGSALMRDLDHALTLIEATVNATPLTVTLKMRLGWDDRSVNAPELARRAEDAGVRGITVHGRTRCQFYKGSADWSAVAQVRQATSLPLTVNGDIRDRSTAEIAIHSSGADAVMIGRASYGAPWLPALVACEISNSDADILARDSEIVINHHREILNFYGEGSGLRKARKHLGWYFENLSLPPHAKSLLQTVMTSFDTSEIYDQTRAIYALAMTEEQSDKVAA